MANNGGPTKTHALLEGSPAIGKAAAVEGITTDQRGVARPQGLRPDIGSFELEPTADRTAPITALSASTADGKSYDPDTWVDQAVTLTLTADDGDLGSGVDKIYYSTDEGNSYNVYTEPLSFTSNTQTTLYYYATDKAGNKEDPPKTFTVRIDKNPPPATTVSVYGYGPWTDTGIDLTAGSSVAITAEGLITIAVSDWPGKTPDGDQDFIPSRDDPQHTYPAPDAHGVSLIGRIGDGTPFEVGSSKTFSVPTSGRLYLGLNDRMDAFWDNGGSWTAHVTVRSAAPTTTASATTAYGNTYNPGDWTNQNVTLTLKAEAGQSGSGVKGITYSVSGPGVQDIGSGATTQQASIELGPITQEGTTTITYYATDYAGNSEQEKTFTVVIDKSVQTVTNPSNGHDYIVVSAGTGGSWSAAEAEAVALGGHLVTINDQAEQDWLVQTFGGDAKYWIGFTDRDVAGTWEWISGQPITYTNWGSGEPSGGDENYAVMNFHSIGTWNDLADSNMWSPQGIAEVIPSLTPQRRPLLRALPPLMATPTTLASGLTRTSRSRSQLPMKAARV